MGRSGADFYGDRLREKTCSRWHQDNFVGRAIVTYTGPAGTDNVNFEELHCCGKSEHCIYDLGQTQQAAVGDLLLMKGTKFPTLGGGVDALVHKLWAGAGAPEGVHAGGRWGSPARRRRRFFRSFFSFLAMFYLFSWEFGVLAAMLSRLATACRRC